MARGNVPSESSTSWPKPAYSRAEVNAAGNALIASSASLDDRRQARMVLNDWRAAHSLPLERVRRELQERVPEDAWVAQRLKRLPSTEAKLRRFRAMKLARMQDIGGCRAVLPTARDALAAAEAYRSRPPVHAIAHIDDYIARPKASGYRGVHLVSRFHASEEDESVYDGMRVEIQLRSRLQHIWATTVETVAIFSGQALKSSVGDAHWLRLFALMGTEIACAETLPTVPETPVETRALQDELATLAHAVDALPRLERYRETLRVLEGHVRNGRAEYFHIVVESVPDGTARVRWNEYAADEREEAVRAFEDVEAATDHFPGTDTVLVRVASVDALRDAYPSYFADTRAFSERLRRVVGMPGQGP